METVAGSEEERGREREAVMVLLIINTKVMLMKRYMLKQGTPVVDYHYTLLQRCLISPFLSII